MSEVVSLVAEMREEIGTGSARALRRKGFIPATIYGAGKQPLSIILSEKEITKYYRKPQYISQVFEFEIGKKKHKVLPKNIQLHPITDIAYHADFVFLEKEMQKMHVPIIYRNKDNCIGVKRGGYFNIVRRTLQVLCPVSSLIRKIELDVTSMPVGTSIRAKDLVLPKGVKLLGNPEFVISSIIGKKGKNEEIEEETEEDKDKDKGDKEAVSAKAKA